MTQQEQHKIIRAAYERNIDVKWAKSEKDIQTPGVHLVEPSYHQVVEGLHTALTHNCGLVIIHSKLTWPYR